MTLYIIRIDGKIVGATNIEYDAVKACIEYWKRGHWADYEAKK